MSEALTLESAEAFAERACDETDWDAQEAVPLVLARDNAVRLALLDEIEETMAGFFKRNPQHAWSRVLPGSIREMRTKYTVKP